MLEVEVSINGERLLLVTAQRVTNTEDSSLDPEQESEYAIVRHFSGGRTRKLPTVTHRYGDGARELAIKALEALRTG